MSEWIYSNNRTVSWSFLDMEKRMAELITVRMKEVYRPWERVKKVTTMLCIQDCPYPWQVQIIIQHSPFSLMSCRATSCWNLSKLSVSSLIWNKIRKGIPSSVSSCKNTPTDNLHMYYKYCYTLHHTKIEKKQDIIFNTVGLKCRRQTSPFSKVISLTRGTHLSWAQVYVRSRLVSEPR